MALFDQFDFSSFDAEPDAVEPSSLVPSLSETTAQASALDTLSSLANQESAGSGLDSLEASGPGPKPKPLPSFSQVAAQIDRSSEKPLLKSTSTDSAKLERYRRSRIWNNQLNPDADNEHYAAQNQTTWDALSAGWNGFKDSFSDSYGESAYSWVRMGKALANWDLSYLSPDMGEAERMSNSEKIRLNTNAIYNDPYSTDDDGIFTKQFLGESLSNLGFSLGTMSEIGTEYLAELGLTALTGGIGAPATAGAAAATTAKATTMLGRAANLFRRAAQTESTVAKAGLASAKALDATGDLMRAGKGALLADDAARIGRGLGTSPVMTDKLFGNLINLAERVPLLGEAVSTGKLLKAARSANLDGKALLKIGAGGVRRSLGEWQMASSEASIEAGSNYGQTYDKLYYEHLARNGGQEPSTQQQERMRQVAMQSATADFATNAVVLAVMNKMMFGNLFSKFLPDSALKAAFKDEVAQALVVSGAGKAGKQLTKQYAPGMMGRLGLIPQIYKDFGGKKAAWETGKALLSGSTKFEIPEGVQELIQEGSSEFNTDYYSDLYNKDMASWSKSFKQAVDSQMNQQGWKTFVSGLTTGVPIHAVTSAGELALDKLGVNKKNKAQQDAYVQDATQTLNGFYQNPNDVMSALFDENVKHLKRQAVVNDKLVEHANEGDRYNYENARSDGMVSLVMHAKRMGTLDGLKSFIGDYGRGMNNEQFEEAFGYKPSEMGQDSPQAVTDALVKQIDTFSNVYDKYLKKFDPYFRLTDFVNDPHRRERMQLAKGALLDAVETIAFHQSKAQDTVRRAAGLLQNIAKYPSLGSSLSSSINRITDHDLLQEERDILKNEITSMLHPGPGATIDAQTRANGENKQRQLDALNEWLDVLDYQKTTDRAADGTEIGSKVQFDLSKAKENGEARNKALLALTRYIQAKNIEGGVKTPVQPQDVNGALDDLIDYLRLNRDERGHLQAVEALSNPKGFMSAYAKLADARTGAYARGIANYYQLQKLTDPAWQKFFDEPQGSEALANLEEFAASPFASLQNIGYLNGFQKQIDDLFAQTQPAAPAETAPAAVIDPQAPTEQPASAAPSNRESIPELFREGNLILRQGDRVRMKSGNEYTLTEIDTTQTKSLRFIAHKAGQEDTEGGIALDTFRQHLRDGKAVPVTPELINKAEAAPVVTPAQETPVATNEPVVGAPIDSIDFDALDAEDENKSMAYLARRYKKDKVSGTFTRYNKAGQITHVGIEIPKGKVLEIILPEFEQALFESGQQVVGAPQTSDQAAAQNAAQNAQITQDEIDKLGEKVDTESKKLSHHVGKTVSLLHEGKTITGELSQDAKGEYEIIDSTTGERYALGADAATPLTLDDFNLRLRDDTAPQLDVVDGISTQIQWLDENKSRVRINGITYAVERSAQGDITGLTYKNNKGRLRTGKKGIYAQFIQALAEQPQVLVPQLAEQSQTQADALSEEIAQVIEEENGIPDLDYQLRLVLVEDMPDEALGVFLNPDMRSYISPGELDELTVWAELVLEKLQRFNESLPAVAQMQAQIWAHLLEVDDYRKTIQPPQSREQAKPAPKPKRSRGPAIVVERINRRRKDALDPKQLELFSFEESAGSPASGTDSQTNQGLTQPTLSEAVTALEDESEKVIKARQRKAYVKPAEPASPPATTSAPSAPQFNLETDQFKTNAENSARQILEKYANFAKSSPDSTNIVEDSGKSSTLAAPNDSDLFSDLSGAFTCNL